MRHEPSFTRRLFFVCKVIRHHRRMTNLHIDLRYPANRDGFIHAAKALLSSGFAPEQVSFTDGVGATGDLFAQASVDVRDIPQGAVGFSWPKPFESVLRRMLCHIEPQRFVWAYALLHRLQSEPMLLNDASDPDVMRARKMAKEVSRNAHKMKAFVRFREIRSAFAQDAYDVSDSVFIAFFEPEHHIVEAVAPFFARRFADMHWSILTPLRSAHWNKDRQQLHFGHGASRQDAPDHDRLEDHWRTYFASIFNPSRLKVNAMTSEMPKKYWHNMPEAVIIPGLIAGANKRMQDMIEAAPAKPNIQTEKVKRLTQPIVDKHKGST